MTRTLSVVVVVMLLGALATGQNEGRSSERVYIFGGFSRLRRRTSYCEDPQFPVWATNLNCPWTCAALYTFSAGGHLYEYKLEHLHLK